MRNFRYSSVIWFLASCLLTCQPVESKREIIFAESAPKPIGPYSQAIKINNMVFVSGQIAMDPATGLIDTSSIEKETQVVLGHIKNILEKGGLHMKHVVKSTLFLTDMKYFKQVNEIYSSFFQSAPPARETVEVKALPKGARIEISVIAVE